MNWMRSTFFLLCVVSSLGFSCAMTLADIKGDVNNDNKIDLVESIYALRIASQSTGAIFESGDINGRVFYEINENLALGQTCIIEMQYGPTEVTTREWLYITDDTWIIGCEDDYVDGEEAAIPYEIVNGIIELTIPGEDPWQIHLVEKFTENYLTSSIDGPSTWYFTKDKVNERVDPKIEFTQDILSANPWYIVEVYPDFPEDPECNGKFEFDGNITLTVQWDDGGVAGEATGIYFHHNGSVTTNHDQKVETETIWTYSPDVITTIKSVIHSDGSTEGTGTTKTWFKSKSDAENFLSNTGANICYPPETPIIVPTVTSATGRIWMDRNLGASRVAEAMDDSEAYGDLYQWGRLADGHEKTNSTARQEYSTTHIPGHGDFITVDMSTGNFDWMLTSNDDLWQPDSGINDPCPAGFRVPTLAEFQAEMATWDSQNAIGAFDSSLKLVLSGRRYWSGGLSSIDTAGRYWVSTVDDAHNAASFNIDLSITSAGITSSDRSYGMSVRCIQN